MLLWRVGVALILQQREGADEFGSGLGRLDHFIDEAALGVLGITDTYSLRCRKSHFRHITEIDALLRLPEIVVVLHGQPTLRRTAESFGKSQRHLRTHTARAAQDSMQR